MMIHRQKLILTGLFIIPWFTLIFNVLRLKLGYQTLDNAIYQQAILDLAFTPSWNPYNTIRSIPIFADHFDPIILLAAGIQRWVGTINWIPFLIEFLFFYFGGFFILWVTRSQSFYWRLFTLSFWLFSDGLLGPIRYALHPTTWSVLPILILAWALRQERYGLALVITNILCLFKEYFPFTMLTLGLFLCFKRKRQYGLSMVFSALIWCLFDFVLRKKLFGVDQDYGSGLFVGLKEHPIQFIFQKFMHFQWQDVLLAMFPTFLTVWIALTHESKRDWMIMMLVFVLPIVAIQFLFGTLGFHYGAPVYAVMLSIIVFSEGRWFNQFSLVAKPIQVFLWFTLIYAGADSLLRTRDLGSMVKEQDKIAAIQKVRDVLATEPPESKIISTMGLIGAVIQPNQLIYSFSGYSQPEAEYDVILIGDCHRFYLWPMSCESNARIKSKCSPYAKQVWIDDSLLYFAKGKFPQSCIN